LYAIKDQARTWFVYLTKTPNAQGDFEMSVQNSVVAVYRTHTEADQAVKEHQRSGVDMHKLSIVGKG
jgi:hypothetical protein